MNWDEKAQAWRDHLAETDEHGVGDRADSQVVRSYLAGVRAGLEAAAARCHPDMWAHHVIWALMPKGPTK